MTNPNPTADNQKKPENFQPGQKPQPEVKDKDKDKATMNRDGSKESCNDKDSCSTKDVKKA